MIRLKTDAEGSLLITILVSVLASDGRRTSVEIHAYSLEEAILKLKNLLQDAELKPPF